MNSKAFCIILAMIISILSYSQSEKTITVQAALDPALNRIIPGDIAYSGDGTGLPQESKIIGYSYRTTTPIHANIGLLNILEDGTVQYSRNYFCTNYQSNVFQIMRIASSYWTALSGNKLYALGALNTTGNIFSPVLLEINNLTGAITNSFLFNNFTITDPSFAPLDIQVFVGGGGKPPSIKMLCVGYNGTAPAGTPKSSLYLLDYNITTNKYSVTRIYNPGNLSAYYDLNTFGFLKSYHFSTDMVGNLSFGGIEQNSNLIDRALVYRDNNSTQVCKAYTLNGLTTTGLQINYPEQFKQSLALQNNLGEIYIETTDFNSNIIWQKFYQKNFTPSFIISGGYHGNKSTTIETTEYFTGEYKLPGEGGQGYSFLRFDHSNGSLKQSYSYAARTAFSPEKIARSYFSVLPGKYYFIANSQTKTTQTNQYFYLIENQLDPSPANCITNLNFTEISTPVIIQNPVLTFLQTNTNVTPSSLLISEYSIPAPVIQPVCGDFGKGNPLNNSDPFAPSVQSMIKQYLSSNSNQDKSSNSNPAFNTDIVLKKMENQTIEITSKNKKIIQYAIYNSIGQLRYKTNNSNSYKITLSKLKDEQNSINFIEIIFSDQTKRTIEIFL